ncbi:decapping nuclease DXO homolog [Aphidius gifuensis]|uniref:decapping nuclease DXO homolog n=1 Tax=Aphidius gifuensis TaxID=684658 RepID=UPI001CDD812D|nr:decapping nuclease DXO homolog [Aphidius gifuensis]
MCLTFSKVEKNKNILLKLNKEEVPQTEFGPPRCVGYFSNGEGSWSPDASQLSYFYPLELSNIHIDLNHGIETIEPDFIMTRSQLRKIMIAIYDEKARWIIRAVKFRGTIYLCPLDTEENKRWASNIPHRQKEHMLWGYNFEKFIFTSDPQQPPDLSQAVNTAETFNCMFQANLNNKLLMYSAEIDGVISDKKYDEPLPLDDLKFIEAKTIKYQLPNNSELKFLNWWCQSYTAGIENIICAFTNCKGLLEH